MNHTTLTKLSRPSIMASFVLLAMLSIPLSACTLGGLATPTEAAQSNAEYTAAAQTIIAQLTQVAQPATETQPAGNGSQSPVEGGATQSPAPGAASPTAMLPSQTPSLTDTPMPTVTETPEPSPTVTEAPTATTIAGDPKLALGDPTLRDNFNNENNWIPYEDEYARFNIKDGQMVMRVFEMGPRNAWILSWPNPKNYYIEMTAQPQSCSGHDRYGLITRSDSVSGYWYFFSCDGEYAFIRWDGENNRSYEVVDWTPSEYILKGAKQTNRLGLKINGTRFTLYANGHELEEARDSVFDKGAYGLILGSQNTNEFIVRVDEITYWDLP